MEQHSIVMLFELSMCSLSHNFRCWLSKLDKTTIHNPRYFVRKLPRAWVFHEILCMLLMSVWSEQLSLLSRYVSYASTTFQYKRARLEVS